MANFISRLTARFSFVSTIRNFAYSDVIRTFLRLPRIRAIATMTLSSLISRIVRVPRVRVVVSSTLLKLTASLSKATIIPRTRIASTLTFLIRIIASDLRNGILKIPRTRIVANLVASWNISQIIRVARPILAITIQAERLRYLWEFDGETLGELDSLTLDDMDRVPA